MILFLHGHHGDLYSEIEVRHRNNCHCDLSNWTIVSIANLWWVSSGCGDHVSKSYISIQGVKRERWQLSADASSKKNSGRFGGSRSFKTFIQNCFAKLGLSRHSTNRNNYTNLCDGKISLIIRPCQVLQVRGYHLVNQAIWPVTNSPITRQTTEGEIHMKYCKWEYEESCACGNWGEVSCCRTHLKN